MYLFFKKGTYLYSKYTYFSKSTYLVDNKTQISIFLRLLRLLRLLYVRSANVQGEFDSSKKSGVGVDFELLVRSLHVRNKVEARKPSMIFR